MDALGVPLRVPGSGLAGNGRIRRRSHGATRHRGGLGGGSDPIWSESSRVQARGVYSSGITRRWSSLRSANCSKEVGSSIVHNHQKTTTGHRRGEVEGKENRRKARKGRAPQARPESAAGSRRRRDAHNTLPVGAKCGDRVQPLDLVPSKTSTPPHVAPNGATSPVVTHSPAAATTPHMSELLGPGTLGLARPLQYPCSMTIDGGTGAGSREELARKNLRQ